MPQVLFLRREQRPNGLSRVFATAILVPAIASPCSLQGNHSRNAKRHMFERFVPSRCFANGVKISKNEKRKSP
jgi:hypothetical protein